MTAYYNEIDPKAAAWLRELIKRGLIADGVVDERSIIDVAPDELRNFTQCHFFAGIGVWSYALRSAGWADDRPVWTGSCPCQPFSAAGRRGGVDDERHLWPHWHHLISQCQPPAIFGEQVASKDGLGWLDLVCADMEATGYAIGAADLCAAGVGAPHIRQRLFFGATRLADANSGQRGRIADGEGRQPDRPQTGRQQGDSQPECSGAGVGMADAGSGGSPQGISEPQQRQEGDAGEHDDSRYQRDRKQAALIIARTGPLNRVWRNADWLFCRDGKWRPVEARPQQMVDGPANGLGRVRDSIIVKLEEEIDAISMESKISRSALLRALHDNLRAQTASVWETGRLPRLHEAPFLLSFLRQLSEQGWSVKEGIALSCKEDARTRVRMLRDDQKASCPSCERGLDGQSHREHSDAVHLLSSVLACNAQASWGDAYSAYAEIGFPIGRDSKARVGRLRGYGNAIVAQVAQTFVESMMDAMK